MEAHQDQGESHWDDADYVDRHFSCKMVNATFPTNRDHPWR